MKRLSIVWLTLSFILLGCSSSDEEREGFSSSEINEDIVTGFAPDGFVLDEFTIFERYSEAAVGASHQRETIDIEVAVVVAAAVISDVLDIDLDGQYMRLRFFYYYPVAHWIAETYGEREFICGDEECETTRGEIFVTINALTGERESLRDLRFMSRDGELEEIFYNASGMTLEEFHRWEDYGERFALINEIWPVPEGEELEALIQVAKRYAERFFNESIDNVHIGTIWVEPEPGLVQYFHVVNSEGRTLNIGIERSTLELRTLEIASN